MSKINKTGLLIQSVNEIATIARNRGIAHLFTDDAYLDGRHISISSRKMINFGSCSYLGLETDKRLKKGAIEAVDRYGTQFSSSRTYVSISIYKHLEEKLQMMFSRPVVLSSSTSLGHQAVIPILVEDQDAVIMDHQAHISMQDILPKLQHRGITATLVRHSRLDELQTKVSELAQRHEKVWYFMDGVYSMYGDLAPLHELKVLLDKNPKLHLYIDDAHGMSWAGPHGTGFIKSIISHHPRIVLSTSLAKGFGSAGGVFILPNDAMYLRIKNWGGPLTYSGPQQPAVIGASLASACIHLSDEIYERQAALGEKIAFCNGLLEGADLPLIKNAPSPIFYIGLGLTKVGYNMVHRLMGDGHYTNLGIFPAVPETCTGIRFTITMHHHKKDIASLVKSIKYHLPKALEEESRSRADIVRAFRGVTHFKEGFEKGSVETRRNPLLEKLPLLSSFHYRSIREIDAKEWNTHVGQNEILSYDNLALLEKSFSNNAKEEQNWDFHYYLIRDQAHQVVLATFFTSALVKNDFLSDASISEKIESMRGSNPYYQTSLALMMGSLITEGEHMYLDRSHLLWKQAFSQLLDMVWAEQEKDGSSLLYLRDFAQEDVQIRDYLIDQGFIKINLPDTHRIENLNFDSMETYLWQLNAKKRAHIVRDVLSNLAMVDTHLLENPTTAEIDHLYALYENVFNHNKELNVFALPYAFIAHISRSPQWEVMVVRLSQEPGEVRSKIIGVSWCYRAAGYYSTLVGLDYHYLTTVNIYKQLLYQIVKRALELKSDKLYFGLTASLEKRKLGAVIKKHSAYIQVKNSFDMSLMELEGKSKEII